jgi:hypothetical protein
MHKKVLGIDSLYKASVFHFFESENYKSYLPPETKYNGGKTTIKFPGKRVSKQGIQLMRP